MKEEKKMTREQKIKNVIEGTTKAIKEMVEQGTMTPEIYTMIIDAMNNTIANIH